MITVEDLAYISDYKRIMVVPRRREETDIESINILPNADVIRFKSGRTMGLKGLTGRTYVSELTTDYVEGKEFAFVIEFEGLWRTKVVVSNDDLLAFADYERTLIEQGVIDERRVA